MTKKPEIQYIGQFYVHGSAARQLEVLPEKRKPRTRLPKAKLERIEKIYVDPVALVAVAVAVFMLISMVVGVMQVKNDWAEYQELSGYLHQLKTTNHEKTLKFRSTYTLEDIRVKATALGMIPKAEAESIIVSVSLPRPAPAPTWSDNVRWFLSGLFA